MEPPSSEDEMNPAEDWMYELIQGLTTQNVNMPGVRSGIATGGGKVVGGGKNEMMKVKNASPSVVSNLLCISASFSLMDSYRQLILADPAVENEHERHTTWSILGSGLAHGDGHKAIPLLPRRFCRFG